MIITIDGPAGTGKTTIARNLARRIGYNYFDTGALYRSITYLVLKGERELADILLDFRLSMEKRGEEMCYFANGEDVTEKIRSKEVTAKVSEISAHPQVREALISVQREFAQNNNAVFEGRDLGTVVFPKADLKIFLTARAAVRAQRRYLELRQKKEIVSEEEVFAQLTQRDHLDSTREIAPLKQAEDAIKIDTSDLTIDQVVEQIQSEIPKVR
ncbi:MAG: (d)CMP kinase [Chlamydiales bacterium]